MLQLITLIHLCTTLLMAGLCLFVAVVHYPLLARIPAQAFTDYEQAHTRLTGRVVAPLMLAEALSAALLLVLSPDARWTSWPGLTALVLLVLVWLITFAVNVPQHNRLCRGWDARTHRALLAWHTLRTLLWLARGVLVAWLSLVP
jgi:hypothetical protein